MPSSEADRTRLVNVPFPVTLRMQGRLKEIAAVPPGTTFSAVVRYLFDIGVNKWKPQRQQYRIEMLEKVLLTTRISLRQDQADRVEQIMAMGYGRAVVYDVCLRLGDRWRPNGNRTEVVEAPHPGSVLAGAEEIQPSGQDDERRTPVPRDPTARTRIDLATLRDVLRRDDSDSGDDDDKASTQEEFPRSY